MKTGFKQSKNRSKLAEKIHHNSLRGYLYTAFSQFLYSHTIRISGSPSQPAARGAGYIYRNDDFLGVGLISGFAVTGSDSHISGLLNLSILGSMIAIFYILVRAPDLVLTQLAIETLTLVIFILVIDKLPEFYGEIKTPER